MRKPLVCSLLLITACGGGSGGPAAPQAPAPTPTPQPFVLVSSQPPVGGTVTLTRTPPRNGREGLTWQVRVTWPDTVALAQVRSIFYNAQGRECASAFSEPSPSLTVRPGIATDFTTSSLLLASACPMPFTTTRLHTQLWGIPGALGGGDHNAGWTFVDGGDVGGPGPQPSGQPPPGGGIPACSGTRPSASCGLATGRCDDGSFTCSENRSGTCSSHGGLACVWCPGPLC
jgi:hypothetical protein